jgi:hypothetical protein
MQCTHYTTVLILANTVEMTNLGHYNLGPPNNAKPEAPCNIFLYFTVLGTSKIIHFAYALMTCLHCKSIP